MVLWRKREVYDLKTGEHKFMTVVKEKTMTMMNVEVLDQETARDVEWMIILRVSTKHNNLWIRLLEMKRKEFGELAGLLRFYGVKKEIQQKRVLNDGRRDAPITSQRK